MQLHQLVESVETSRQAFIAACSGLTPAESHFKVSEDSWSITNIVEHIVRAEWGGLNGIWQAMEGYRSGAPLWSGPNTNEGQTIEAIVERTWQRHQPAPEPARPQWGGPIGFWLLYLQNGTAILRETFRQLEGLDPASIIYPHPLSGPLNVYQRMEFLRYHMDRHRRQIEGIREVMQQQ